jgi:adenylate cyclase
MIEAWLVGEESRRLGMGQAFTRLIEMLRAKDMPIARAVTSVRTRHPEVFVENLVWTKRSGLVSRMRPHAIMDTDDYRGSPGETIHRGADRVRWRVSDQTHTHRLADELRADGITDYVAFAVVTSAGRTYLSFATDASRGFTDEMIDELSRVIAPFAARIELAAVEMSLQSLLEVYLGRNAAARVRAGAFKRGGGEAIHAAIWFCDMRDFTRFADTTPPSRVVFVLDRVFDAIAGPIEEESGEILKFIGDAVLAIFPVDGDPAAACRRALAAGKKALAAIANLDAVDRAVEIGIALHLGEVFYGNIGARNRLDFTVIGAAVNEACRVESLTKPLGRPLLVTSAFADALGREGLVSLGEHALKGVERPAELFAPKS